jgi:hypothetical protein
MERNVLSSPLSFSRNPMTTVARIMRRKRIPIKKGNKRSNLGGSCSIEVPPLLMCPRSKKTGNNFLPEKFN